MERQLLEIFKSSKLPVFSTSDLCRRIFRTDHLEKKHRVSVLRAMKRLAEHSLLDIWRTAKEGDQDDTWFDRRIWKNPKKTPPHSARANKARPPKTRRGAYSGRI